MTEHNPCRPSPGRLKYLLRPVVALLILATANAFGTLKLETDAGQQTRLLHFAGNSSAGNNPTWQGYSAAKWSARDAPQMAFGGGGRARGGAASAAIPHGSLEVVTRNLRPGYLRKNGVPYSDRTVLTEYYDRVSAFTNDYMVVTTVVEDPVYLTVPFITTSHFKREPDDSKWDPAPCGTDPPVRPVGGTR
jgi:hypothetical protein